MCRGAGPKGLAGICTHRPRLARAKTIRPQSRPFARLRAAAAGWERTREAVISNWVEARATRDAGDDRQLPAYRNVLARLENISGINREPFARAARNLQPSRAAAEDLASDAQRASIREPFGESCSASHVRALNRWRAVVSGTRGYQMPPAARLGSLRQCRLRA